MKKFTLLFSAIILGLATFAQAPNSLLRSGGGINYQTVIRDGSGNILPDTELSLQMTIRSGAPDGEAVYTEIHNVVSNAYGLVSLVIGNGNVQNGNFANIAWGKNSHYLETAIVADGSGNYVVMGTTQFLSVPYANYSGATGGILSMTSQERNALQNPPEGMQIYNSTTNCLNYYNGYEWYETCGTVVVNQPPDIPINPVPYDGAIEMPFDLTLGWTCADPDNDPLTFDLYFGNLNPPDLYQSGITDFEFPVSQLDFGTIYYWKVVAHDNNNNFTEGPEWSFQTTMCLAPQVWAGDDAEICGGENYQLSGVVDGPISNIGGWTTDGDGTFSNPAIVDPVYTFGAMDFLNGQVTLTLTAFANEPCPPVEGFDEIHLTIIQEPTVDIGFDLEVCGEPFVQLYATAHNFEQIQWITSGTGIFTDENVINPKYYFSNYDYTTGMIDIIAIVGPIWPVCQEPGIDTLTIYFNPPPGVDAGDDGTICNNENYAIDATQTNACGLDWTTSGDGTFSDTYIEDPIYYPGPDDNGIVTLTLTALPCYPCPNNPVSDDITLFVQGNPTVDAGPDQTVCENEMVQLNANATNYSSIMWVVTNGMGDFNNPNQANPIYFPSWIEIMQGFTNLSALVYPISPCLISAEDELTITYLTLPIADAGSNQPNLQGTTTTLAGNTPPEGGSGLWSIVSGTGGSIAQPTNPTSQFSGLAGNYYTLQWMLTAPNGCIGYDEVAISFATNWTCGQSFTDSRDGKVYTTKQVGTQCWMKQNLNIGTRITGTSNQTNNGTIEKYCYNNTESNCTTYGGLYQWDEMMQYTTTAGVKGICPTGWHLPTDAEWTTLTTYVSSQTAYRCNSNSTYIAKSLAATTNWTTYTGTCTIGNNLAANNATGFTALPGGYRNTDGSFDNLSLGGYWCSSAEYSTSYAWVRYLYDNGADVGRSYDNKSNGFSVRCLKD